MATEINAVRKLGRRPPKKAPAIALGSVLTGLVPQHPIASNHLERVPDWGMYGNDRFGVCGPTSVAHSRKLVTSILADQRAEPTQDDVFDLYRRSGNPSFDPDSGSGDNGVDMQTMLEAVTKDGIGGVRCLAFARVDVRNLDQMRAAIAIFGFVLQGITLQVSQDAQTDSGRWDYQRADTWGGHAVLAGSYVETPGQDDTTGIITWNMLVTETEKFLKHQLDEAWVVIWPEALGTRQFEEGINMAKLKEDFKAMTGRDLDVGPEPEPTPEPPPPPKPPRIGWIQSQIDAILDTIKAHFARVPFLANVIQMIRDRIDAYLQANPQYGRHHKPGVMIPAAEMQRMIHDLMAKTNDKLHAPARNFAPTLHELVDHVVNNRDLPDAESIEQPGK